MKQQTAKNIPLFICNQLKDKIICFLIRNHKLKQNCNLNESVEIPLFS